MRTVIDIFPSAMAHAQKIKKKRNRRILTATMYGHFALYESLNSCTRAHFCCGLLEVGSPVSASRFSPCISIAYFKNPMLSGDIRQEHYRQHCKYRFLDIRCIARGLTSTIINGNMCTFPKDGATFLMQGITVKNIFKRP